MLEDPDFDCLAANTTAGFLICSDPALAIADKELNSRALALIPGMKDVDAKAALGEYARWTRNRDRKCDLDDKDNVPLAEFSSSEACLADHMSRKTAEIIAAKGDAKRVFRRSKVSPAPMPTRSIYAWRRYIRQTLAAIFSESAVLLGSIPNYPPKRPWSPRKSNEDSRAVRRMQFNCHDLHRSVLGSGIGPEVLAGDQGKPAGRAQAQDREVVCVSQGRGRRLAL
jgi:uncharacterized protein YecT (DUF1311 family)